MNFEDLIVAILDDISNAKYLLQEQILADHIYEHYYVRGCKPALEKKQTSTTNESDFIKKIQQANKSEDRWSEHWMVNKIEQDDYLEVSKNEIKLIVHSSRCKPIKSFSENMDKANNKVAVFFPKEHFTQNNAFYFVHGNAEFNLQSQSMVRLYWNVRVEMMPQLVAQLSSVMNYYAIPFDFKCLCNPLQYSSRADVAVLYTDRMFADFTVSIIPKIIENLNDTLIDNTPLFSYPIAKGIAFAENPKTNESFGGQRSRLISEAILMNLNTVENKHKMIAETRKYIQNQGYSIEQFYLNSNSKYPYTFLK